MATLPRIQLPGYDTYFNGRPKDGNKGLSETRENWLYWLYLLLQTFLLWVLTFYNISECNRPIVQGGVDFFKMFVLCLLCFYFCFISLCSDLNRELFQALWESPQSLAKLSLNYPFTKSLWVFLLRFDAKPSSDVLN